MVSGIIMNKQNVAQAETITTETAYKKVIEELMTAIIEKDSLYQKEPQYAIIGGRLISIMKKYNIDFVFKDNIFKIIDGELKK